jgi:triacylglycerol lipase
MIVPKLRSPIVLVHGICGFDYLRVCGWTIASYFSRTPELLSAGGNRVFVARVSPTGAVAARAAQLRAFLDRQAPGESVHIMAHSMGGLDARYLIARLGMAGRVLTLTTLGTPHRGTAFADWGLRHLERIGRPLFDFLGIPPHGFYDLTTTSCRAFNEQVPDAPGVRYFSVAGRHVGSWRRPEWQLPHYIVTQNEGPNDGIVAVRSASYGEATEVWDGDHISLLRWLHPPSGSGRAAGYPGLVRRLADEGF